MTNKFNFLLLILITSILTACAFPGSTKPVIKIGLIAPFEGEQRANGYQRLYGVKLALQQTNLAGGIAGYKIGLIALNDYGDKIETVLQSQEIVLDPDIKGIIGHWEQTLFEATIPIYATVQMPVINPTQFSNFSQLPSSFETDFKTLSGTQPDTQAKQAYLATIYLLQAFEQTTKQTNTLNREAILENLK